MFFFKVFYLNFFSPYGVFSQVFSACSQLYKFSSNSISAFYCLGLSF